MLKPQEEDNLMQVENLSIRYISGKEIVQAVRGVSFTIKSGECMGLVGETGAGKTTTALGLLSLLPKRSAKITDGKILFHKRNVMSFSRTELQAYRGAGVSMIFQDPMSALNPIHPVGKQIREALIYHNYDKVPISQLDQKVDKLLRLVGISPERKIEYPHQFSGGMMQRVCIAMALIAEPELIIADEPTTALDVTIQAQVLGLINELRCQTGNAVLLITHDLGVVAKMCQNVAVMYAGEIMESGSAESIFHAAKRHPYTEGLFCSIPNLKVKEKRLRTIPGLMPDPTKLPVGCSFYPRCPQRMDCCVKMHPELRDVGENHKIRCHLFHTNAM